MNEDAATRFSSLPGTALALAVALIFLIVACGGDSQPLPDIEATVEASVEQALAAQPNIDAIVEVKIALALSALPAPTPIVVVNEVVKEVVSGRPVQAVLAEDAFEDIVQNAARVGRISIEDIKNCRIQSSYDVKVGDIVTV